MMMICDVYYKIERVFIDNDCTTVRGESILSIATAQGVNVAQTMKHRDLCCVKQAGEAR